MTTTRQQEAARRKQVRGRRASPARPRAREVTVRPNDARIEAEHRRASGQLLVSGERTERLTDAAHVRNALARFDRLRGVNDAARSRAWGRIWAAADRFGVELSEADWHEFLAGGAKEG